MIPAPVTRPEEEETPAEHRWVLRMDHQIDEDMAAAMTGSNRRLGVKVAERAILAITGPLCADCSQTPEKSLGKPCPAGVGRKNRAARRRAERAKQKQSDLINIEGSDLRPATLIEGGTPWLT